MNITKTKSIIEYTVNLSERELKVLVSALTVCDMKKSSDWLVTMGEEPSYHGDDGDDLHYQLFKEFTSSVEWLKMTDYA